MNEKFISGFVKRATEAGFDKDQVVSLCKQSFELPPWVMQNLVNPVKKNIVDPVMQIPANYKGFQQNAGNLDYAKKYNSFTPAEQHFSPDQIKRMQIARNERMLRLARGVGTAGAGLGLAGLGASNLMGGPQQ